VGQLQGGDVGGSQAVAVGDKDYGRIAMSVAAMLARAVHQALDLALGEIAPFNCQVYDVWGAILGSRFHRDKTSLRVAECQANPDRWTEDGTMRDYLENEDKYIYWSTPEHEVSHTRVRIGTRALIVRTASTGRFGPRAIIAVGTVEESPQKYQPGNESKFLFPTRLKSPGGEHA